MPSGRALLTGDAWGVEKIGDVVTWRADVKVNGKKAPETYNVSVVKA
jgi:hypothetical protein